MYKIMCRDYTDGSIISWYGPFYLSEIYGAKGKLVSYRHIDFETKGLCEYWLEPV